jgi:hypothetical protein
MAGGAETSHIAASPAIARQRRATRSSLPALSSGKLAIIEKTHEFVPVPWRPIIDRQLGREVMGVVQGNSVSWQLERQKGLSLELIPPLSSGP